MNKDQLVAFRKLMWELFVIAERQDATELVNHQVRIESFVNDIIDTSVMTAVTPLIKLKSN